MVKKNLSTLEYVIMLILPYIKKNHPDRYTHSAVQHTYVTYDVLN